MNYEQSNNWIAYEHMNYAKVHAELRTNAVFKCVDRKLINTLIEFSIDGKQLPL